MTPDLLLYHVEQYLDRTRRIRIQELDSERGAIARRVPYADGTRFLVLRNGRAVYQSDHLPSVIYYMATHQGCELIDLADWEESERWERKQIGRYLAPRDPQRAISPVFDPNVGKHGKFGLTQESLLKNRYHSATLPEPQDATPLADHLIAFLKGQPIGTANRLEQCAKCGLTVSCKCVKREIYHTPPMLTTHTGNCQRYDGPRQSVPYAATWIGDALTEYEFRKLGKSLKQQETLT